MAHPRQARLAIWDLKKSPPKNEKGVPIYPVLIAPHISESVAELCKEEGIGYLDFAGNCELDFGGLWFHVEGRERIHQESKDLKSLFYPKSARILRHLLQGPLREWKVKELVEVADVSLGQVSKVRQKLLARKFAEESEAGLRLTQPDELLDEWVRSDDWDKRSEMQEYSLLESEPDKIAAQLKGLLGDRKTAFTQWYGAFLRRPYALPNVTTLYVEDFPEEGFLKKKLFGRRVDQGGASIGASERQGGFSVSPGDSRNKGRLRCAALSGCHRGGITRGRGGRRIEEGGGLFRRVEMSEGDFGWESYPADGLKVTERALFEAWGALEKFRRELVLVGGLAVYLHTRNAVNPLYGGVPTLDVDFGINLGTDAGMKGTVQFDLLQAGYHSEGDRMVKTLDNEKDLYLDFLTEHPPSKKGSRNVSDIIASICPGINRALEEKEFVEISGVDRFGDSRSFRLPICGIGPLLVLKLNAFAQRSSEKKGKDAYDILAAVSSYSGGALAAIEAFDKEKHAGNPAMSLALETLERDFIQGDSLAK